MTQHDRAEHRDELPKLARWRLALSVAGLKPEEISSVCADVANDLINAEIRRKAA